MRSGGGLRHHARPGGGRSAFDIDAQGFSLDKASGAPVFSKGELANNIVAKGFGLIPDLPDTLDISYESAEGAKSFTDLVGKVRILDLWADWCPPCLKEMPELAALQAKHGGDRFEIVAIETGSHTPMDFATARKTLDDAGGQGLPLWVEVDGGWRTLGLAISDPPPPMKKGPNIPCAVLVDVAGKVRGHMIGIKSAPRTPPGSVRPARAGRRPDMAVDLDDARRGRLHRGAGGGRTGLRQKSSLCRISGKFVSSRRVRRTTGSDRGEIMKTATRLAGWTALALGLCLTPGRACRGVFEDSGRPRPRRRRLNPQKSRPRTPAEVNWSLRPPGSAAPQPTTTPDVPGSACRVEYSDTRGQSGHRRHGNLCPLPHQDPEARCPGAGQPDPGLAARRRFGHGTA